MRALPISVTVATVITTAILAACGSGSSSTAASAAEPAASAEPAPAAAPAPARPLDQDLPTLVTRAVEMFETISSTVVAGGTDCPAIAASLRTLQARYEPVITAARKVETEGRGAEVERLLTPHQDRVKAAVESMRPGVEACMSNPDFQRAFSELTGA